MLNVHEISGNLGLLRLPSFLCSLGSNSSQSRISRTRKSKCIVDIICLIRGHGDKFNLKIGLCASSAWMHTSQTRPGTLVALTK